MHEQFTERAKTIHELVKSNNAVCQERTDAEDLRYQVNIIK